MALGKTISTWWNGRWHDGNLPVLGAADHGAWQGTLVFDGARAFEGVTPDLDLHCARIVRSAGVMGMEAPMEGPQIEAIVREGLRRYPPDAQLYLRPMMWSRDGGPAIIDPMPDTTSIAICIEDLALPGPRPFSLTLSPFRRPRPDMALTEAKAACLYANNGRIASEARRRGFDNALSLDCDGHVAETASTNVFAMTDGVVFTPAPNGMFLNGITRQRVIALLRADGVEVRECVMEVADFAAADEIFLTGNASKVTAVTRFEERTLKEGRMAALARALYWNYAHQTRQAA